MTEYRRFRHPGATWFFTVNLAERHENRLLRDQIDLLRETFSHVKAKHPYKIDAVVILPEHLHCILTLPMGDSDFSTRWGLIKAYFSRNITKSERISKSRDKRGERGLYPEIGVMILIFIRYPQENNSIDAVRASSHPTALVAAFVLLLT